MMSNEALVVIPLWLCVAVSLALLVLSARSALIQRREGLLPSMARLYVAAGGFVHVGGADQHGHALRAQAVEVFL